MDIQRKGRMRESLTEEKWLAADGGSVPARCHCPAAGPPTPRSEPLPPPSLSFPTCSKITTPTSLSRPASRRHCVFRMCTRRGIKKAGCNMSLSGAELHSRSAGRYSPIGRVKHFGECFSAIFAVRHHSQTSAALFITTWVCNRVAEISFQAFFKYFRQDISHFLPVGITDNEWKSLKVWQTGFILHIVSMPEHANRHDINKSVDEKKPHFSKAWQYTLTKTNNCNTVVVIIHMVYPY